MVRESFTSSEHPIAFFSSEYALEDELPLYAGGLGVLAGDFLLEAGEQGLPFIAVGLFYRRGFETFNFGTVNEDVPDLKRLGFDLVKEENGRPIFLEIELGSKIIFLQVWQKSYGEALLFLLDTAVDKNDPADQEIAAFLYPKDFKNKLIQEIVFGIGAVKLFRKLNIRPSIYHLNEGHTAFIVLGLVIEYLHDHPEVTDFTAALEKIKPEIVATKHTILPVAGLFFSRTDFQGILDIYLSRHKVSFDDFCSIGSWEKEPQIFSMTKFLFQSSIRGNVVSKLHVAFEKHAHPHSELFPITNAINLKRWQAPELHGQGHGQFSDKEFWKIHGKYRADLVEWVNRKASAKLKPQVLTLVWARRFAAYKRPRLLFSNPKRLLKLVTQRALEIQIVISGQPNISDEEGISFLKEILKYTQTGEFSGKLVWLPDYSLALAKRLVLGADVWLNTPEPGKEASGTSGMKSSSNGGLQFSTLDGWYGEVDWRDKGWILAETGIQEGLYDMLEKKIIPLFYERDENGLPRKWIKMMRNSIDLIQKEYSTKRMLKEYLNKLYFPRL